MADARAKELIDLGDRQFSKREPMLGLWNEIALNVYPERADFFTPHPYGADFAGHLMDSFPVLLRDELGNSISSFLRPRATPWFKSTTLDDATDNDADNARYLEHIASVMRRGLYDPRTRFIRATKEGDHDFVSFGNAVISVEEAPNRDHLLYRTWHLRDSAWLENEIGEIDHLHRKDAMTARTLKRRFGEKVLHESVKRACEKEPGKEFQIRVVALPADEYDYVEGGKKGGRNKKRLPFVIIYVDAENGKILREGGLPDFPYVVPRWHTVSGSPYAFSPATITALPDARMAQNLARILLEAGEKAVDPPLIAKEETVREANIQAGAMTWVDAEYDKAVTDAVASFEIGGDMRTGFAMRQDLRDLLTRAFRIDKLSLPEAGGDMTAYEVSRRLEEHVRNLLPLFEPMEIEYNTRLLDKSFILLRNMGRFDIEAMPDGLSGADITWAFESPLQQASNRVLVQQYTEVMQLVAAAREAGETAVPVKMDVMLKDAIRGTSAPATWRKTDEEMEAEARQAALTAAMANTLQQVAAGANVATQVGDAANSLKQGFAPLPEAAPAEAA